MESTITLRKQNGTWVGTFWGAAAQPYAYLPELREELDRLGNAQRGTNVAFVYEGAILRAAQSTLTGARQYMNNARVLVTFEGE